MVRFAGILLMAICVVQCTSTSAQRHNRPVHREPSLFGFSIGIGNYAPSGLYPPGVFDPYAFDGRPYYPYRYGSFKAPDLLDDPYFRERHRFDSRYPGRYRTRTYRGGTGTRQPAGAQVQHDRGSASILQGGPNEISNNLVQASERFSRNLAAQQHSDAWLQYLAPDQIRQHLAEGNTTALRGLLRKYEGVVANRELRAIAVIDGFDSTRQLLRQYLEQR